ncbi:MAG TPA: protein kinase [Thermoanaerobaculia bacterium]|nr:protein kinase [Thermoanaerobaculia bacterium]
MIGSELGSYRITARLGKGGMGEVYRATDSRLGREVAIKVLPDSFASDPERLARFEREARVLASLNHPNIASIYGLEQAGETRALVLELVEGPTLAERMAEGRLPLEEALEIARQIAEALEDAHEKGIVHRDLKPANVKLAPGGKVKVLDFGLAKALDPMTASGSSSSELAHSPTLTIGASVQGVILGTAAYMSPEQARGASADRRADVWAFGVVLFEMLSGRTLFVGPTVSDTLASVLKVEPDPAKLPAELPGKLRHLLERCLRKDRHQRLHAIADARIVLEEVLRGELDEPAAGVNAAVVATPPVPLWRRGVAVGAAALAGALVAVGLVHLLAEPPAPAPLVRFEIPVPEGLPVVGAPMLSPDGRHLAFAATDEAGTRQVWIRSLDSLEAHPLPGSEGITYRPFWSPDSRFIAFIGDGRLKKVALSGGPAQVICDALTGADGSWSESGQIAFDGTGTDPILQVPSGGGVPTVLLDSTMVAGRQVGWPQFLPGGEKLLFVSIGEGAEGSSVHLANADGSQIQTVVAGLSRVEFAPPDRLLYVRQQTLVAQRFDLSTGSLTGEPIPIAEGLGTDSVGLAAFSVSRGGVLAYRTGSIVGGRLVWVDRQGAVLEELGGESESGADTGDYGDTAISPDGRWLAYSLSLPNSGQDLWVRDLRRGVSSRLTFEAGRERQPLFTADSRRVIYSRPGEATGRRIVSRSADGTGEETVLLESEVAVDPQSISADGTLLAYTRDDNGQVDLWLLDLSRPGEPRALADSQQFYEARASLSPDGRWIAYESNESGAPGVYVRSTSGAGRWQVSTRGGTEPLFGPDGRELYYLTPSNELMRVPVTTADTFEAGLPEPLFRTSLVAADLRRRYLVAPDGQRFLTVAPISGQEQPPTTIVLNWTAALDR